MQVYLLLFPAMSSEPSYIIQIAFLSIIVIRYTMYMQKQDWLLHKQECVGIARISPNLPTDSMRLLLRCLLVYYDRMKSQKVNYMYTVFVYIL